MIISIIIGSTGSVINFPANTDAPTILSAIVSATNADPFIYDFPTTITRIQNTFSARPTMPRIALMITDGQSSNKQMTKEMARQAAAKDIQVCLYPTLNIIR